MNVLPQRREIIEGIDNYWPETVESHANTAIGLLIEALKPLAALYSPDLHGNISADVVVHIEKPQGDTGRVLTMGDIRLAYRVLKSDLSGPGIQALALKLLVTGREP